LDVGAKCRVYREYEILRGTRMYGLCFVGCVCVHVFAKMRSFGYQIAKFYMNARMLKISFYTCICYYLLHVCSECADRLPFRSRIHDFKDHGVLLFSFVLFSFFLTNNCSLLYHFLSFVLYCFVLFFSFCIHCV